VFAHDHGSEVTKAIEEPHDPSCKNLGESARACIAGVESEHESMPRENDQLKTTVTRGVSYASDSKRKVPLQREKSFRSFNRGARQPNRKKKTDDSQHRLVALKFMCHRDQFRREVETRESSKFDEHFVVPLLGYYDDIKGTPDNVDFRKDAILKGYGDYPYCVVMEASQSLKRVIDQQLVAGNDWEQIRQMTKQIAFCLKHIHEKGIIHGDLKRKFNCHERLCYS